MTILRALLVTFIVVSLVPERPVARQTGQAAADNCVATLHGSRFPWLIPEYSVWERLFLKATDGNSALGTPEIAIDLQLTQSAAKALASLASITVNRAEALRATPRRQSGPSPETMAADLILDARDDMLRSLLADDRDKLSEYAKLSRRQIQFTFPKRGKPATNASQQMFTCPVSISGKEHPELIPEAFVWEFHLTTLASVSAQHRTAPNAFADDYISTLRRVSLPIPEADLITLLNHASETATTIYSLRTASLDTQSPAEGREAAVSKAVHDARLQLLLRLPRSSWMVVNGDARNRRRGMIYDFPTSF